MSNLFPAFGKDKQPLEVISELERCFRHPDIGKQCEAILITPHITDMHPFPIVVNTVVMKLAALFHLRFLLLFIFAFFTINNTHNSKALFFSVAFSYFLLSIIINEIAKIK